MISVYLFYIFFHIFPQQQLQHIDFDILILMCGVIYSVLNLFLFCFYGKLATESHENMADSLYEANWMKLPIKLQKHCILMIQNIQMPLYYHGFGLAVLDLETFTAVGKFVSSFTLFYPLLQLVRTLTHRLNIQNVLFSVHQICFLILHDSEDAHHQIM